MFGCSSCFLGLRRSVRPRLVPKSCEESEPSLHVRLDGHFLRINPEMLQGCLHRDSRIVLPLAFLAEPRKLSLFLSCIRKKKLRRRSNQCVFNGLPPISQAIRPHELMLQPIMMSVLILGDGRNDSENHRLNKGFRREQQREEICEVRIGLRPFCAFQHLFNRDVFYSVRSVVIPPVRIIGNRARRIHSPVQVDRVVVRRRKRHRRFLLERGMIIID